MRSLLKEMEEKFVELEETTDAIDSEGDDKGEDLEEQNVAAAVAPISTPNWVGKAKRSTVTAGGMTVAEAMDRKYESIIESYRSYATGDAKLTPESKIKHTIKEVAKQLQEIEQTVNYASKLKTESGVARKGYGPSVDKALNKISERLIKISERVRALGE